LIVIASFAIIRRQYYVTSLQGKRIQKCRKLFEGSGPARASQQRPRYLLDQAIGA
jgi:hypothetical protein